MFSTIYYNIARKRDATASDPWQRIHIAPIVTVQAGVPEGRLPELLLALCSPQSFRGSPMKPSP